MSGKSREGKCSLTAEEKDVAEQRFLVLAETSQSPGQRKPCQKQVLGSDSGNQDGFASARSSDFERLHLGGMNDDLNYVSGC